MAKAIRRFGDRKDGRKIRSLDPYNTVSPYIMVSRSDAQNYLIDKFETTEVDLYVQKKRKSGLEGFGILHVILTAYVRMISQRPGINRFISGQKIYARQKIIINMVAKKKLRADETDTVIKVVFEQSDTAEDVYKRFTDAITKAFGEDENDFDGAARILNYIPGLLKKTAVWFLKMLDYFGLLPIALINVSPFHGSMFITSMGSLGIPPIYHHLYNFGNVPVFLAFGAKRSENQIGELGNVVKKKYIDYTFVTDERICDGFYFASGLKLFRAYLANPSTLDVSPQEVIGDVE
nr:hypothetical protein [uncultured Caproiciproducens sp.]